MDLQCWWPSDVTWPSSWTSPSGWMNPSLDPGEVWELQGALLTPLPSRSLVLTPPPAFRHEGAEEKGRSHLGISKGQE